MEYSEVPCGEKFQPNAARGKIKHDNGEHKPAAQASGSDWFGEENKNKKPRQGKAENFVFVKPWLRLSSAHNE